MPLCNSALKSLAPYRCKLRARLGRFSAPASNLSFISMAGKNVTTLMFAVSSSHLISRLHQVLEKGRAPCAPKSHVSCSIPLEMWFKSFTSLNPLRTRFGCSTDKLKTPTVGLWTDGCKRCYSSLLGDPPLHPKISFFIDVPACLRH